MTTFTFRLKPGQDLKTGIEEFASRHNLKAASVLTCVGGLAKVTMRMAGATPDNQDIRIEEGHFEIVSLTGTISPDGSHLHIAVSKEQGVVTGGHLKEGATVYPTAEVVIYESAEVTYARKLDPETGFPELIVEQ
jgi:predicted DNA-binding protein with PD1-like motif